VSFTVLQVARDEGVSEMG